MAGVIQKFREGLFGRDSQPRSVFDEGLGQDLAGFFRSRFDTPTLEDPRLVQFLDKANREIDRTLKGAQQTFDRGLGPNQRRSGDAAAFQRDLAIAGSEGKSAAFTDIVKIFEEMKLEGAAGALALLTATSEERERNKRFGLDQRVATGQLSEGFFGTIAEFFQ